MKTGAITVAINGNSFDEGVIWGLNWMGWALLSTWKKRAISIVNCCDVAPKEGIASLPVSAHDNVGHSEFVQSLCLYLHIFFDPGIAHVPTLRGSTLISLVSRTIGLYQLEETCPGRDAFRTIYINLSKSTTFSQVHWLLSQDMPRQSLGPPHFQTQRMGHNGHNMISMNAVKKCHIHPHLKVGFMYINVTKKSITNVGKTIIISHPPVITINRW
jgi:hypothetical protein